MVPVAASDAEGTLELFVNEVANTGATSLSEKNARPWASSDDEIHAVPVRAARLDDVLADQNVQRVDLIKMDI